MFLYRWVDKTDSPQPIVLNFATKKLLKGMAMKIGLGERIPKNEPTWLVHLNLKDIVELALSSVHTDSTICFLDSKMSEYRHRFQEAFPQERLTPKHNFLEHYPQLIKSFGPLVSLWTMRFEAKHSFFKRVVRHNTQFLKHSVVSLSEASVNGCIPSTRRSHN